jgi:hypothetical protein
MPRSRMYSTYVRNASASSGDNSIQLLCLRGSERLLRDDGEGDNACTDLILRNAACLHRTRHTKRRRTGLQLTCATGRAFNKAVFIIQREIGRHGKASEPFKLWE